ncbi:MAG: hypothetical protein HY526_00295 [Betaproteobacteria bacterium]|nr:hypothetical protein [Betaproteobacteria bacterium]
MAQDDPRELSGERIKESASEWVRKGEDIRRRVHDLTLLALRSRRFDRREIREVVRAITEGVTVGADQSRADMRQSLSEAFRGLDEALRKSSEAGRNALRQLVATGRDFSDQELKQALANIRKIEDDFLSTVGQVADAASERVRPELRAILDGARRSGTETGRQAAGTMTEFAQRFSAASIDVTLSGLEAASEFGARFAQVASGVLAGIADALGEKRSAKPAPQEAPPQQEQPGQGNT